MVKVKLEKDHKDLTTNTEIPVLYPTLYNEVIEHDEVNSDHTWYELSEEAYREYVNYLSKQACD